MVHAFSPSTGEEKAGGPLKTQGQPVLQRETLSQKKKSFNKTKQSILRKICLTLHQKGYRIQREGSAVKSISWSSRKPTRVQFLTPIRGSTQTPVISAPGDMSSLAYLKNHTQYAQTQTLTLHTHRLNCPTWTRTSTRTHTHIKIVLK